MNTNRELKFANGETFAKENGYTFKLVESAPETSAPESSDPTVSEAPETSTSESSTPATSESTANSNPSTGIAVAALPVVLAASAVIASTKKRK